MTRMHAGSRWVSRLFLLGGALLGLASIPAVRGADTPQELEKRARALLEAHCFKCHSHQANKSKGGLLVDSLAALLRGGDTGPALVPGQPEKSLLIKAVLYEDDDLQMPPKGKLA